MDAPKKIKPETMAIITDIHKMLYQDRQLIFEAYEYDQNRKYYYLAKPEVLNEELIKKIWGKIL